MAVIIQDWLQTVEDVDPSSVEIEDKRERIHRWLAAPDPSSNYYAALKKRQPDTGDWFIQGSQFYRWCKEAGSFIWLCGAPGCGKTLLASTVIGYCIQQFQNNSGRVVVYYYFDFVETEKRKHEGMVRSLITQLTLQTSPDDYGSPALLAMLEAFENGECEPSRVNLLAVLRGLISRFTDVYIVLDALDECVERDGLLQDLKDIVSWSTGKLHLLVTSRMEDKDVQWELRQVAGALNVVEFNDDHRVRKDPTTYGGQPSRASHQWQGWQTALRMREDRLAVKMDATRVSQWIFFQLDQLKKCMGAAEIRNAFGTILTGLEDKYASILSGIPYWHKLNALKIMQWLVHSRQPLRLVEVAEFTIADNISYFHIDGGRLRALRSLLSMMPNMVTIRLITNNTGYTEEYVQLAHFSVQEYLVSDRIRYGPAAYYSVQEKSANANIAETCLAYLLQFNETSSLTPHINISFPLSTYAAKHWASHALKANHHSSKLNELMMELFHVKPYAYINFIQILYSRTPWTLKFSGGKKPVPSPLYYACLSGLTAAVSQLLKSGADINRCEGAQGSALHVASARGNIEIVKILLDYGVVPDRKNARGETPATLADSYGHQDVAEVLCAREASGGYGNNVNKWLPLLEGVESEESFWPGSAAFVVDDYEE